jgi:hypothetical protein
MRKYTYFDTLDGPGWPDGRWLERYFLTAAGQRQFFASGNDSWGLSAEGVDGTNHLQPNRGRIDINLTILGNADHGVLLFYRKWGGGVRQTYYSKGDVKRLFEWVTTAHGDRMPVGLFIPFETAWKAIKQFMEIKGALPTSIDWLSDKEIPAAAFPAP